MSLAYRTYKGQQVLLNEHGQNAQNRDMVKLLGLRTTHLPKEGMPFRDIQGIKVYVRKFEPSDNLRKSSYHRVRALCPHCSKDISAGRLFQHVPACKQNPNTAPKKVEVTVSPDLSYLTSWPSYRKPGERNEPT